MICRRWNPLRSFWLLSIVWASAAIGTKSRSVQEVLVSVEEKLRSLESLGHMMRLSGLHYGMDQMNRRMDAIEVRLSHMETKLNVRLDKMTEAAIARDRVKTEHIVRKIEATGERTATVLDFLVKVRGDEKGQAECRLPPRVEQAIENAARVVEREKRWETDAPDATERTANETAGLERFRAIGGQRPTEFSADDGREIRDPSAEVADVERSDGAGRELPGGEVEIFTRKVMNTYQELLKESKAIDVSLKEVVRQSNRTRVTVAEGFRKFQNHRTKSAAAMEELLRSLLKTVVEMSATVDASFSSLLVAQNTFIASCDWVQQQREQSEPVAGNSQIRSLLERLVDEIGNRTMLSSLERSGVASLKEAFENHERNVGRALRHLASAVIQVGNQTVSDVAREMCDRSKLLPIGPGDEHTGTNVESAGVGEQLNDSEH